MSCSGNTQVQSFAYGQEFLKLNKDTITEKNVNQIINTLWSSLPNDVIFENENANLFKQLSNLKTVILELSCKNSESSLSREIETKTEKENSINFEALSVAALSTQLEMNEKDVSLNIEKMLENLKKSQVALFERISFPLSKTPQNKWELLATLTSCQDKENIKKLMKVYNIGINDRIDRGSTSSYYRQGSSLLGLASYFGNLEMVEFFLSMGADPNYADSPKSNVNSPESTFLTRVINGYRPNKTETLKIIHLLYHKGAILDLNFEAPSFFETFIPNLLLLIKFDSGKTILSNLTVGNKELLKNSNIDNIDCLENSLLAYICKAENKKRNQGADTTKYIKLIDFLIKNGAAITELDWLKAREQKIYGKFSINVFGAQNELSKLRETIQKLENHLTTQSPHEISRLQKQLAKLEEEIPAILKEKINKIKQELALAQLLPVKQEAYQKQIALFEKLDNLKVEIPNQELQDRLNDIELKIAVYKKNQGHISEKLKAVCSPKVLNLLSMKLAKRFKYM